jgi:hypothetical protein
MGKIIGLVGVGFCLGIGFWLAKKSTEPVDNWLAKRDAESCMDWYSRVQEELKNKSSKEVS